MDTTGIRPPPRPPIDCIAEGIWKIACGESCHEFLETASRTAKSVVA